jgi:hypothetical protein
VLADAVHVSPDGRRTAAWENLVYADIFDIPAQSGKLTTQTAADPVDLSPKGPTSCDDIIGWTDDHTVLCSGSNKGYAHGTFVTQDVDTPTAPTSDPILPANDRQNVAQIISSDGKQFVFVSQQGDAKDFYVSATTPGDTPKKIERRLHPAGHCHHGGLVLTRLVSGPADPADRRPQPPCRRIARRWRLGSGHLGPADADHLIEGPPEVQRLRGLLVAFEQVLEVAVAVRRRLFRLATHQRQQGYAESVAFEVEGERHPGPGGVVDRLDGDRGVRTDGTVDAVGGPIARWIAAGDLLGHSALGPVDPPGSGEL